MGSTRVTPTAQAGQAGSNLAMADHNEATQESKYRNEDDAGDLPSAKWSVKCEFARPAAQYRVHKYVFAFSDCLAHYVRLKDSASRTKTCIEPNRRSFCCLNDIDNVFTVVCLCPLCLSLPSPKSINGDFLPGILLNSLSLNPDR